MLKYLAVMKMKEKIPLSLEAIIKLNADREFRRLTGVWPETFKKMLSVLKINHS